MEMIDAKIFGPVGGRCEIMHAVVTRTDYSRNRYVQLPNGLGGCGLGRSDHTKSHRISLSGPVNIRRTSTLLGCIGLWFRVIVQRPKSGLIFGDHAVEHGR